jgi:hypothetical protein
MRRKFDKRCNNDAVLNSWRLRTRSATLVPHLVNTDRSHRPNGCLRRRRLVGAWRPDPITYTRFGGV